MAAIERPILAPPYPAAGIYHDPRREHDTMSYLANIIGPTGMEDDGPGMDTLEGWLFRVATLVEQLRKEKANG